MSQPRKEEEEDQERTLSNLLLNPDLNLRLPGEEAEEDPELLDL